MLPHLELHIPHNAIGRHCAAVVGGSISVGLGEDGFGPGLFRRIAAAFPNAPHRFHNGALGGVMSTYMNSCLKWHVPADVDLVIVSVPARASACTCMGCTHDVCIASAKSVWMTTC